MKLVDRGVEFHVPFRYKGHAFVLDAVYGLCVFTGEYAEPHAGDLYMSEYGFVFCLGHDRQAHLGNGDRRRHIVAELQASPG